LETLEDGEELGVLAPPQPQSYFRLRLTRDGSRLLGSRAIPRGGIDVWDLRLIGERLRQRGLQQGWPDFAPAAPPGKPLKVPIEPGPGPREAALLRLTLALFERPFDAEARYQRGMMLCDGTPGEQQLAHADLTLAIMQAHKDSAEAHHRRGRLEE